MTVNRTSPISPNGLYSLVESYASFGNHHTGTQADRATTAWLTTILEQMGATVHHEAFSLERFDCDSEMFANGVAVPSVPMFYSAVGSFDTTQFATRLIDRRAVGNAHELDRILGEFDLGEPVVVAFDGPDDLPVQCNRVPTRLLGQPAVIVARNWLERVRDGGRLRFNASLVSAQSSNVVALLGQPDRPEVFVTTPLTGWTPAAGERGTGLAVALALASSLAHQYRVRFSACSGHELDHLGLRHHLSANDADGKPVIHLGASVAATEPVEGAEPVLGHQRIVLTSATDHERQSIARVVGSGNWVMGDPSRPWPGEGGTWVQAGAQVLSFLGSFSLFHTVGDVAAKATTPHGLQTAANAVIEAADIFLANRV